MKRTFYFAIIIISLFSCKTVRLNNPDQISLKEANRILKEAIQKTGIIDSSKNDIVFNNNLVIRQTDLSIIPQNNIIYYDTVKIIKLQLNNFSFLKSNKKIKLINKKEIFSDTEIIGYWNITFLRLENGLIRLGISSDFYIPPSKQPIEIDGVNYWLEYRIVNGKAELIRWRGF